MLWHAGVLEKSQVWVHHRIRNQNVTLKTETSTTGGVENVWITLIWNAKSLKESLVIGIRSMQTRSVFRNGLFNTGYVSIPGEKHVIFIALSVSHTCTTVWININWKGFSSQKVPFLLSPFCFENKMMNLRFLCLSLHQTLISRLVLHILRCAEIRIHTHLKPSDAHHSLWPS